MSVTKIIEGRGDLIWSAAVILRTADGIVLQHRDNRPDIQNPGMLGLWAGAMEQCDGGYPDIAAQREGKEETGLELELGQLSLLFTYCADAAEHRGKSFASVVYEYTEAIDPSTIDVREGQGIGIIHNAEELERHVSGEAFPPVTPAARDILRFYFEHFASRLVLPMVCKQMVATPALL